MKIATDVTIHAHAHDVWDVLMDVEQWPEWTSTMTRVTRLDDGPLALGRRARIKQPGMISMEWSVTDIVANESFTWRATSPGLTLEALHALRPSGDDAVLVHLEVAVTGVVGSLASPLMKRRAGRAIRTEAEGLKARVEGTRDKADEPRE